MTVKASDLGCIVNSLPCYEIFKEEASFIGEVLKCVSNAIGHTTKLHLHLSSEYYYKLVVGYTVDWQKILLMTCDGTYLYIHHTGHEVANKTDHIYFTIDLANPNSLQPEFLKAKIKEAKELSGFIWRNG